MNGQWILETEKAKKEDIPKRAQQKKINREREKTRVTFDSDIVFERYRVANTYHPGSKVVPYRTMREQEKEKTQVTQQHEKPLKKKTQEKKGNHEEREEREEREEMTEKASTKHKVGIESA